MHGLFLGMSVRDPEGRLESTMDNRDLGVIGVIASTAEAKGL